MEPGRPRSRASRPLDAHQLCRVVADLGRPLADYIRAQRWFGSKGRTVEAVAVVDHAALPVDGVPCALTLLEVGFAEGPAETYLVPLAARRREALPALPDAAPLVTVTAPDGEWVIYDALEDEAVAAVLLRRLARADRLAAARGSFVFDRTPVLSQASGGAPDVPAGRIRRLRGEQSNTSLVYDDRFVLKLFRRLQPGENPDLEVTRFLTLKTRFRQVPLLAGFAQYQGEWGSATAAVLHTFVPNRGDAWTWTLDRIAAFYGAVRGGPTPASTGDAVAQTRRLSEETVAAAGRLGGITGELHVALASDPGDPAFAPEPVTAADLEAWGAAIGAQVRHGLHALRVAAGHMPPPLQGEIARVLAAEAGAAEKLTRIGRLAGTPLWKTRTHGDYHLGQVLRTTDGDFVVLDFEGEPARPLAARRAKHSPLRDVAGMLRSFTYASYAGAFAAAPEPAARAAIEPWRAAWEIVTTETFLDAYLAATVGRGVPFVPASRGATELLLSLFCLEKAAYELHYELNNRPAWLPIPLEAIQRELVA